MRRPIDHCDAVLSNEDSETDIHFYINSPGGVITAGLAVYDTMRFLRCPVATYCVGQAASMAAVLFAGGRAASGLSCPTAVLLHQPLISGVMTGAATDIEIEARKSCDAPVVSDSLEHTGKQADQIEKDCDRNLWLEAEEAVAYGLADQIRKGAADDRQTPAARGRKRITRFLRSDLQGKRA